MVSQAILKINTWLMLLAKRYNGKNFKISQQHATDYAELRMLNLQMERIGRFRNGRTGIYML